MAHFAEIDSNNIVQRVLVVANDQEHRGADFLANDLGLGGTWIQCSFTYDPTADVFIAPQPWPSWALDANHDWQAPVPMPLDGKVYQWVESTLAWMEPDMEAVELTVGLAVL
jgi:hypothetical protein